MSHSRRDETDGNYMATAENSRIATGRLEHPRSPLPFLLEFSAAAKALASMFSSRTPVAAQIEIIVTILTKLSGVWPLKNAAVGGTRANCCGL